MEMRARIELSGLVEEQRLFISIILSPISRHQSDAFRRPFARVAFFLQICPTKSPATFRSLPSIDPSMLYWLPGASSSQNHAPEDYLSMTMIRIGLNIYIYIYMLYMLYMLLFIYFCGGVYYRDDLVFGDSNVDRSGPQETGQERGSYI